MNAMNESDVVLAGLAELPAEAPPAELSRRIRAAGHRRLVPKKVHPVVSLMVAASVLAYLSWALVYTGQLG
jgi:hypothetical protein